MVSPTTDSGAGYRAVMSDFHPVQTLQAIELWLPRPGTKEPFAILRWVDVVLEGEPVSRWRVVSYDENPKRRRLLADGYYRELEDAAAAAYQLALASMSTPPHEGYPPDVPMQKW